MKHLTRNKLKNRINVIYNEHIEAVKTSLKYAKYVCTTADIWTAPNRRIIGVTAHWVNIIKGVF